MKRLTLLAATAVLAVGVTQANAGTFPVNKIDSADSGLVDTVALRVHFHHGHRYCFYFSGWHGPGWYRCGFAFHRGVGWGGDYGWNDWSYGPAERRFGHRHGNASVGIEERSRSSTSVRTNGDREGMRMRRDRSTSGTKFDTRTRSNTTTTGDSNVRTRNSTNGSATINSQSNTGAKVQGGTTGTTGGANVQHNSGAKVGGQTDKSSGTSEKKPQQ